MAHNAGPSGNWLPYDDTFFCDIPLTVLEHFNWSTGSDVAAQPELDNVMEKLNLHLIDDGNLCVH